MNLDDTRRKCFNALFCFACWTGPIALMQFYLQLLLLTLFFFYCSVLVLALQSTSSFLPNASVTQFNTVECKGLEIE